MRRQAVAGVDEVGRGALAGPVVVCAVVLERIPDGLADSKALSEARRLALVPAILACGRVALAAAPAREVDRLDVLRASLAAMARAVRRLSPPPVRVLVDGREVPELDLPVEGVVGGDRTVPEIQAASIVAKTVRDRLMRRLHRRYPDYGFLTNVGYPTARHLEALRRLGPTPHHRLSFAPVRAVLGRR